MSTDLLSQDEIDALLHGVDGSDLDDNAGTAADGTAKSYDFGSQDRIIRGRLPTLEMINERFARYFRVSLFNMMRRSADVSILGVQMTKFSEYVHTLFVPTSLNIVKIKPLRGNALIVIDPNMVFTLVDNFFGGDGRFHSKVEGREFTPTEYRVIEIVLDLIFHDFIEAWKPVMPIRFEFVNSEVNPQFANIVSPTEVVVSCKFSIELEAGGGEIELTLPYSMIEPIRDLLDAGIQSDSGDKDERWVRSLKEGIEQVELELITDFGESKLLVKDVLELEEGDIIPLDKLPETMVVRVEKLPVFAGKLGVKDGRKAIKLDKWLLSPTEKMEALKYDE